MSSMILLTMGLGVSFFLFGLLVGWMFATSEFCRLAGVEDESREYCYMNSNEMPDAVTCQKTPRDQFGDPIQPGSDYILSRHGGSEPCRVTVSEDPATSDLYYRRPGIRGERSQRVDQSDPGVTWRLVTDAA